MEILLLLLLLLYSDRLVSSKRVGKVEAHSWGVSYHVLILSTEPLGQCSDTLPGSQCRALVRCLSENCMHCVHPHTAGVTTVCVEGPVAKALSELGR